MVAIPSPRPETGEHPPHDLPGHPVPPLRIPLHHITLQANIPAGLNLLVVAYFAHRMRTTPVDVDDPELRVKVRQGKDGGWVLKDGRHRLFSAWIAGRYDIACELEA